MPSHENSMILRNDQVFYANFKKPKLKKKDRLIKTRKISCHRFTELLNSQYDLSIVFDSRVKIYTPFRGACRNRDE